MTVSNTLPTGHAWESGIAFSCTWPRMQILRRFSTTPRLTALLTMRWAHQKRREVEHSGDLAAKNQDNPCDNAMTGRLNPGNCVIRGAAWNAVPSATSFAGGSPRLPIRPPSLPHPLAAAAVQPGSGSGLPSAVVFSPPSTYMISPVMPLARSESRKAAALPTSSMVMLRRSGALWAL